MKPAANPLVFCDPRYGRAQLFVNTTDCSPERCRFYSQCRVWVMTLAPLPCQPESGLYEEWKRVEVRG